MWFVIFQPRGLFDGIRVEHRASRQLLPVNLVLAGVAFGGAWATVLLGPLMSAKSDRGATDLWLTYFLSLAYFGMVSSFSLVFATWIEWLGIRFFGARRGWRVTQGVATGVCAHASFGWILGGVLAWVAAAAGLVNLVVMGRGAPFTFNELSRVFAVSLVGAGVGLLAFEVLVYVGVRRCRFANGSEELDGGANEPGAPIE
jgi:hypothetical protein